MVWSSLSTEDDQREAQNMTTNLLSDWSELQIEPTRSYWELIHSINLFYSWLNDICNVNENNFNLFSIIFTIFVTSSALGKRIGAFKRVSTVCIITEFN